MVDLVGKPILNSTYLEFQRTFEWVERMYISFFQISLKNLRTQSWIFLQELNKRIKIY